MISPKYLNSKYYIYVSTLRWFEFSSFYILYFSLNLLKFWSMMGQCRMYIYSNVALFKTTTQYTFRLTDHKTITDFRIKNKVRADCWIQSSWVNSRLSPSKWSPRVRSAPSITHIVKYYDYIHYSYYTVFIYTLYYSYTGLYVNVNFLRTYSWAKITIFFF